MEQHIGRAAAERTEETPPRGKERLSVVGANRELHVGHD